MYFLQTLLQKVNKYLHISGELATLSQLGSATSLLKKVTKKRSFSRELSVGVTEFLQYSEGLRKKSVFRKTSSAMIASMRRYKEQHDSVLGKCRRLLGLGSRQSREAGMVSLQGAPSRTREDREASEHVDQEKILRKDVYNTEYYVKQCLTVVPLMLWITISGFLIGRLEGWTPLDSFYTIMVRV